MAVNNPPQEALRQITDIQQERSASDEGEHLSEAAWDAVWREELKRRLSEIDEGRAELIPAEEVFAELRARFPQR